MDENVHAVEPDSPLEKRELAALALALFLKLTPRQRSCVILKDVLDYSLAEISECLGVTVPEIKALLHRGRQRLRSLAGRAENEAAAIAPRLNDREQKLLVRYVDRFNARDFDGVREVLADEVRLDRINKARLQGAAEVSDNYFHNYTRMNDWRLEAGSVEGRPAVVVFGPDETATSPSRPIYFMLLAWDGERVSHIRDYRYARRVTADAEISLVGERLGDPT